MGNVDPACPPATVLPTQSHDGPVRDRQSVAEGRESPHRADRRPLAWVRCRHQHGPDEMSVGEDHSESRSQARQGEKRSGSPTQFNESLGPDPIAIVWGKPRPVFVDQRLPGGRVHVRASLGREVRELMDGQLLDGRRRETGEQGGGGMPGPQVCRQPYPGRRRRARRGNSVGLAPAPVGERYRDGVGCDRAGIRGTLTMSDEPQHPRHYLSRRTDRRSAAFLPAF